MSSIANSYRRHLRYVAARRRREHAFHVVLGALFAADVWMLGGALGWW